MKLRLALLVALLALTLTASAHGAYPNSIASTGDSITRAFNDCWFPYVDCPVGLVVDGDLELLALPPHPGERIPASAAARTTTPSPARTWPTSTARCRA